MLEEWCAKNTDLCSGRQQGPALHLWQESRLCLEGAGESPIVRGEAVILRRVSSDHQSVQPKRNNDGKNRGGKPWCWDGQHKQPGGLFTTRLNKLARKLAASVCGDPFTL